MVQFLLRISGIAFYLLLFIVLVFRIKKAKISELLGKITFPLAFIHPLFYVIYNYLYGNGFNLYAGFINFCLLCDTPTKYYLSIGIAALWLLIISVFLLIKKWKYFYTFIYLAFFLTGIHGYFLGSYFRKEPFFTVEAIMYAVILGIFLFREAPKLYKNFREWKNS